ncbi:MAG: hypothetical protein GY814_04100 [Gammaproteobacteria bacterium]|nr:hypothetical protein [Gammaproteobacteria bacterium]
MSAARNGNTMDNKKSEWKAARQAAKERKARFVAEFPEWFTEVPCGFYLPEEWEPLLWTLCENIRLSMLQVDVPLAALTVGQVKEKFWGLRFYYSLKDLGQSEEMERLRAKIYGMTSLAESLSISGPFAIGPVDNYGCCGEAISRTS